MSHLLEKARSIVQQREIELVIVPAIAPFAFGLHAEFDGYGDYFTILAQGVRHVEVTSGMLVNDLRFVSDVREILRDFPRWAALGEEFAESAVVLVAASDTIGPPRDAAMSAGILVAERIEVKPGRDW